MLWTVRLKAAFTLCALSEDEEDKVDIWPGHNDPDEMLPPFMFHPPPPPAALQGTIPVAVYWATCGGAGSRRLFNRRPAKAEKVEGCRAAGGAAGGSDGVTRT